MTNTCPGCNGMGVIIVDCPHCRNTENFEHEDLASDACPCCNDKGYTEDMCPICNGTGMILEIDHILKI